MNRRVFLSLPRLYFSRSEFHATLASPTLSGRDQPFDLFQHGNSFLFVRGGTVNDVRLSIAFETWAEGETARELLLAAGL